MIGPWTSPGDSVDGIIVGSTPFCFLPISERGGSSRLAQAQCSKVRVTAQVFIVPRCMLTPTMARLMRGGSFRFRLQALFTLYTLLCCALASGVPAVQEEGRNVHRNITTHTTTFIGGGDLDMAFGASKPAPSADHDPVAFAYRYPQVPLEVEEYSVAPEPLQLEQVHVYVRHGERTPVGVRLAGPPANVPEHWAMCRRARRFRSALSGILGNQPEAAKRADILHARKIVERKDGNTVEGEWCVVHSPHYIWSAH